ncbi:hypothetical protein ACFVX3_19735 [Rhodococcus erythropolis]
MGEPRAAEPVELREIPWTTAADARSERFFGAELAVLGSVGLLGFGIFLGISEGGAAWWWMLLIAPGAVLVSLGGLSLWCSAPENAAETERLRRDGARIIAHVVDFTENPGEGADHNLRLQFEHPTHGTTVVEHRCGKWSPPVHGRKSTLSLIVTDDAWSAPHRPTV